MFLDLFGVHETKIVENVGLFFEMPTVNCTIFNVFGFLNGLKFLRNPNGGEKTSLGRL